MVPYIVRRAIVAGMTMPALGLFVAPFCAQADDTRLLEPPPQGYNPQVALL